LAGGPKFYFNYGFHARGRGNEGETVGIKSGEGEDHGHAIDFAIQCAGRLRFETTAAKESSGVGRQEEEEGEPTASRLGAWLRLGLGGSTR
jgi:hypothetical protein